MSTKIISKKENQLFGREEYIIEIDYPKTATPNRKVIVEEVIKITKVQPELLSIRSIKPAFGASKGVITAHVYKDKALLEKNEPKHIIKRFHPEVKKEGEAGAQPAPAAAPTPAAPKKEEKKEAKK
ncbi:30S ribosomal protein S24e [Candidatus Tiddalikarchaeum anstoanum]|nr:30S ribosomal protein S24e [Candidatus Tiddalikarchaeum anstoanum]